jgi:hypothetical protein
MSCKPARSRRSQTAARGAHNCPAVTSDPPLLPKPTGERGGQPCRRHATAPSGRASPTPTCQRGGLGPCVTQPARRMLHASNCTATCATIAPPRLRNQYRDSRRPSGTSLTRRSNTAKSGPTVMAVAGGREQRSRRQPGSHPIRGQQENPLSRREDDAPVIRSSSGSRTRNGRPANHSPRRINSAVGQAALLAGEAGDASPSPK